jgi:uncharacterized metal-binding protein
MYDCSTAPKLIFSCSGSADVGAVADQTARKLTRDGIGNMFCLAGIGGRVSGMMKTTEAAQAILAIDGCPVSCAKKCLEVAGFTGFKHLQLADIGMTKGATNVDEAHIAKACAQGEALLQGEGL